MKQRCSKWRNRIENNYGEHLFVSRDGAVIWTVLPVFIMSILRKTVEKIAVAVARAHKFQISNYTVCLNVPGLTAVKAGYDLNIY